MTGRLRLLGSLRALGAIGVFSAAVIAVSANIVAARFYERWDLTRSRLYTLSEATLQTPNGPLPQAASYFYARFGGLT